jgi:hypothetical protein
VKLVGYVSDLQVDRHGMRIAARAVCMQAA